MPCQITLVPLQGFEPRTTSFIVHIFHIMFLKARPLKHNMKNIGRLQTESNTKFQINSLLKRKEKLPFVNESHFFVNAHVPFLGNINFYYISPLLLLDSCHRNLWGWMPKVSGHCWVQTLPGVVRIRIRIVSLFLPNLQEYCEITFG